jgi:crotonobetainyl-CoA:carnitine CoA-transferase CaiB-like acyl-CoA transferase
VQHPEAGAIPHTRAGFTLSRTSVHIERHAPVFGQDNEYVLRELLGLGDDEVAALRSDNVVRDEPPASK